VSFTYLLYTKGRWSQRVGEWNFLDKEFQEQETTSLRKVGMYEQLKVTHILYVLICVSFLY